MNNTLLPPNATPLELALEAAMRPGLDVREGVGLIRTAKEDPPDDWLFFLVWEFGLEELLPYLPDPRVTLEKGLQWQRIRGTPDSIRMALSWLDLSAIIEEAYALRTKWWEYSLDPGKIPTPEELANIVGLARLSAPVGTRLVRLYHGYDYRRAVWDYTAWSDGSLWSDDSGVYDPDLDADLSFGRIITSSVELGDIEVFSSHISVAVAHAQYEDRALWDFSFYSDLVLRNYAFTVTRESFEVLEENGVGRNLRVIDGSWTLDGTVVLSGGFREELPQFPATHTTSTTPEGIIGWSNNGWGHYNWYGN